MNLNESNQQWVDVFAEYEGITPDQVLNNALIDFRARMAAEQAIFHTEPEEIKLKQFQKTDDGLLEGENLWDFLVDEYLEYFSQLKQRMIQERFFAENTTERLEATIKRLKGSGILEDK